jgi:osmotically-inducible protein OsmY
MRQEDKETIKAIQRQVMRLPVDGRKVIITVVGGSVYLRGRIILMRTAPKGTDINDCKTKLITAVRRLPGVKQVTDQLSTR